MRKTIFYAIIICLLVTILSACRSVPSKVKDAVAEIYPGAKIVSAQEVIDERTLENVQNYIQPGVRTVVISGEGEIRYPSAWCVVLGVESGEVMIVVIENDAYVGATAKDLYDIMGCTNYY